MAKKHSYPSSTVDSTLNPVHIIRTIHNQHALCTSYLSLLPVTRIRLLRNYFFCSFVFVLTNVMISREAPQKGWVGTRQERTVKTGANAHPHPLFLLMLVHSFSTTRRGPTEYKRGTVGSRFLERPRPDLSNGSGFRGLHPFRCGDKAYFIAKIGPAGVRFAPFLLR